MSLTEDTQEHSDNRQQGPHDPYESHKLIYDIIDSAVLLRAETLRLSKYIDDTYTLPNSLQATLGMIYRYEGMTQSQLAGLYNQESKNLIRSITALEKRGLVERRPLGRQKQLFLTPQGAIINDRLMRLRGDLIEALMSAIDGEALAYTRQTLIQLAHAAHDYVSHVEKSHRSELAIVSHNPGIVAVIKKSAPR